jgi:peptidoglycan/LPS O-acetylase OafA/YrhL
VLSNQDVSVPDVSIVAGNTAHTKPENNAFYPALDGLRALAFLMVFGAHYLELPWGWAGVDLFFVLSGFLITGILFDTRDDPYRVRNFYVRRTLRIFPLYYAIMLALLLVAPLAHWQWDWYWLAWPLYIGNFARFIHPFAHGDPLQRLADFQPTGFFGQHRFQLYLGHFWSLCVEEQFYLAWPWLVFWIRGRGRLITICAATLPLCLAMRIAGEHALPPWMLDNEFLYRVTPLRLDALLLGGLIALILRGRQALVMLRAARTALPIALSVVILWILFSPSGHIWKRPCPYPEWKFTWGLSIVDFFSALLILNAVQSNSLVYWVLSLRPLRWVGRMSYGAYVFHDIFHAVFLSIAVNLVRHTEAGLKMRENVIQIQATLITTLVAFMSTLLMAWLSFKFFETPFLNLKERWTIRPAK